MKKYLVFEQRETDDRMKNKWFLLEETDSFITAIFVYGKNPSDRVITKNIDPMELNIKEK